MLATTGRDVCAVIGLMPRCPRDLAAMMRRLGVRDLSGVVSAVHGPAINRRLARRGDIVRRGWALGTCRGELAVFYGGRALEMCEIDEAWALAR
ncbi:MAG: hypothetical protein JWQ03_3111 [Variovorax sp.]|nr:hypothetical protein [Variovorax sp.]